MNRWLNPEDWKRGIALVILWAYAYQLIVWPAVFYLTVLANYVFDLALPAPVIVPWEQLIAGTTTLATVGGIQAWRDGVEKPAQITQVTQQTTSVTQPIPQHNSMGEPPQ